MKDILKQFSFEGKTAIVIGGAGVLGSVIARGFGQAGATVAIADIVDTKPLIQQMQDEGINARGYYIDVMDKEKIKIVKDEILKDLKQVDILVNAAGGNQKAATVSPEQSFFDLPLEALQKVIGLNLFGGGILPCQVFGQEMVKNKEGGSIINISSMTALRPLTNVIGYSAAKAAVSNLTQWLAVHFAKEYNPKLRVNALAPGFFLTNQNRYLLTDEKGGLTPRGEAVVEHTPMKKFGDPEDLVGVCLWLASSTAQFVTGIVVPIDGGFDAYAGV